MARGQLELFARSAGERATDTVHVIAEPEPDAQGRWSTVVPVSGVRDTDGPSERIAGLVHG